MNDILQERGLFWDVRVPVPPGHFAPDSAVVGGLTIGPDGQATLQLDGLLPSPTREDMRLSADTLFDRCIVGLLNGSRTRVRLEKASMSGALHATSGPSCESFTSFVCLVGVDSAVLFAPSVSFSVVELALDGLEHWLRFPPIDIREGKSGAIARYRKQEDRVYELTEGSLALRVTLELNRRNAGSSVKLEPRAVLIYTGSRSLSPEDARDMAGRFKDLLVLLTNSEVRLPFATVRVGPDLSPVTLYATRRSQKGKTAEPHEFWTTFQLIADNFGALADGWIRKAEDLGAAFHLYTATRRGEHLFTEHKFVNLIWGLEALQRRVGPVVDNQRSETKISGMLDRIENAADQKCLRKLLKRAADPALKDRLAAILGRLKLPVDQKALRRFAQRCAEARNDISHLGGPRHGTSYTAFVVELHKFAQALDPLYHALILQEIGMSLDLLHQVLLSGRQSMWVRDALREVGLDIPHTPNFAPTI